MTMPLEERIKNSLDQHASALDNETMQRLQAIRRNALNQPKKSWLSFFQWQYWVPATGVVFCSIIAALLLLPQSQTSNDSATFDQMAMLELLENAENIDVLSDVGFYLWMDELEAQNV